MLLATLLAHLGEVEARGIHLLLRGPHLTEANHLELLALAKYRRPVNAQRLGRLGHCQRGRCGGCDGLSEDVGHADPNMGTRREWSPGTALGG